MNNPVIGLRNFLIMSRVELDLLSRATDVSGLNFQEIMLGSPSNARSPSVEPPTSTPAGSDVSQNPHPRTFHTFTHY